MNIQSSPHESIRRKIGEILTFQRVISRSKKAEELSGYLQRSLASERNPTEAYMHAHPEFLKQQAMGSDSNKTSTLLTLVVSITLTAPQASSILPDCKYFNNKNLLLIFSYSSLYRDHH